jgi:hypothetical protein
VKRTLAILAAVLALPGCTNSLYFYETGKLSITIEGRPDSSQPVQGSLGFKQRSAVVSPPLRATEHKGDAGAMISSFRVKKEAGVFGPVTIRTALVTGAAADVLDRSQTRNAALALVGAPIATYAASARHAWENSTEPRRTEMAGLACIPWSELTEAQRTRLGVLTGAQENYSEPFHAAVALQAGCPGEED